MLTTYWVVAINNVIYISANKVYVMLCYVYLSLFVECSIEGIHRQEVVKQC